MKTSSRPLQKFSTTAAFLSALALSSNAVHASEQDKFPVAAQLDIAAELPMRPGNVTGTTDGRIFATVHPLSKPSGVQLIEITGKNSFRAWPNKKFQNNGVDFPEHQIDSPIGVYRDGNNRLWIMDLGLHIGKSRVWGFDIASGKLIKRYDLPADVAPKGSFVQDVVVDEKHGWMYLADIANPGLIALNMKTGQARRFSGHQSLRAEPDAKMIIDGKQIYFQGNPAEVAVNPITISADKETIFFGAMNGRTWYGVPSKLFRDNASDEAIGSAIYKIGSKPISDGATTDARGNHFFTNVTENGIDVLTTDGELRPYVRDPRMIWPDGLQFGSAKDLYISVNQLYKAAEFTGGQEEGKPPFYIFKVTTRYQKEQN